MTRLWNPEGNIDSRGFDECSMINSMRVDIIRRLSKIFSSSFVGGVSDSAFAREFAPDLILPKNITFKKNYLRLMKNTDICIGSMGLHKSTGWKTAEYVAADRAIVCEKLWYDNPGDFQDGRNYLMYETADECVDKILFLVNNPDEILKMSRANERYYSNYLCPDKLIMNAIMQVIE